MSQCQDCTAKRSPDERLAGIEVQLVGLNQRIDEVVISQLRDHGKRIAAIERRWWLLIGYMLGSGLVGAAAVKVFM